VFHFDHHVAEESQRFEVFSENDVVICAHFDGIQNSFARFKYAFREATKPKKNEWIGQSIATPKPSFCEPDWTDSIDAKDAPPPIRYGMGRTLEPIIQEPLKRRYGKDRVTKGDYGINGNPDSIPAPQKVKEVLMQEARDRFHERCSEGCENEKNKKMFAYDKVFIRNGTDKEIVLDSDMLSKILEKSASSILPKDSAERKTYPIFTGALQYFPRAIASVANQSYKGNQKHHPDKPLHWDKPKSNDHSDCLIRHLVDSLDPTCDKKEELTAVAWRALALLETYLEGEGK